MKVWIVEDSEGENSRTYIADVRLTRPTFEDLRAYVEIEDPATEWLPARNEDGYMTANYGARGEFVIRASSREVTE